MLVGHVRSPYKTIAIELKVRPRHFRLSLVFDSPASVNLNYDIRVSLQPKCGFLPVSAHVTRAIKRSVCRFCMHQHENCARARWRVCSQLLYLFFCHFTAHRSGHVVLLSSFFHHLRIRRRVHRAEISQYCPIDYSVSGSIAASVRCGRCLLRRRITSACLSAVR